MFIFKKAMNSFVALSITTSCLVEPSFVKANHNIVKWSTLSKKLEFETEEDRNLNFGLLSMKSCVDNITKNKFKPHWILVMELKGKRFYAMVPGESVYWQRFRDYEWSLPLENKENDGSFISNMSSKTPGYSKDKISLYFKSKNNKYRLYEVPLCTCPIITDDEKSNSANKEQIICQLDDEKIDLIFCNFLITEKIEPTNEKSKERIIRWPCWLKNLIGNRKFKEPKKDSKPKKLDSSLTLWIKLLDNESLMWLD